MCSLMTTCFFLQTTRRHRHRTRSTSRQATCSVSEGWEKALAIKTSRPTRQTCGWRTTAWMLPKSSLCVGVSRPSQSRVLTHTAPRPRLSSFGSSSVRGRRTDVPLIFTISLTHLFNLLFRLPPPTPPPRLFSGGTPLNTPPVTPRASQSGIASISAALAAAQARTEVRQSTAAQRLAETQRLAAESSPSTDSGDRGGSGRIPGDYWTTRVHG